MEKQVKKKFLYWLRWWGVFFLYLVILGSLLALTANNKTFQITIAIVGILLSIPLAYKIFKSRYIFTNALFESELDIKKQTKDPIFLVVVVTFLLIIGFTLIKF